MTSLIDLMFLLVIFVLVAARFEPSTGLKIVLPSGQEPVEAPPRPLTVFVTRDSGIFLEDQPVALEDFLAAFSERRASALAVSGEAPPSMVIYGDRDAPWGLGTELLELARRAGQANIVIRTRKKP